MANNNGTSDSVDSVPHLIRVSKKFLKLAPLAVLPVLAACGGGDGDEPCRQWVNGVWVACTPAPKPPSTTLPEGIWGGASSNGFAVSTLVLENGYYVSIYSSDGAVRGLVQGILTASGGKFTDPAAVDFSSATSLMAASVSGSFNEKQTMSGTVQVGGQTVSFNGNYNSLYDTAVTLADVQGTWTGALAGSSNAVTVTVGATGAFTGTDGVCNFSGTVTPRSTGKHVLDGTVTFQNSSCALGAGTSANFEAVPSGSQVVAAGVTSQRNGAFVFIGNKK
ncbi:hypothetical protein [Cupriavidus pinatubonensis]|uniref:hypothetical protein n=1 Tax=Cupriavidus pinatubonensis TaxID=248026 RepID=UPI00112DE1F4|nr:hypothetical protein [Cupriavidus pinatubonensis]